MLQGPELACSERVHRAHHSLGAPIEHMGVSETSPISRFGCVHPGAWAFLPSSLRLCVGTRRLWS